MFIKGFIHLHLALLSYFRNDDSRENYGVSME